MHGYTLHKSGIATPGNHAGKLMQKHDDKVAQN